MLLTENPLGQSLWEVKRPPGVRGMRDHGEETDRQEAPVVFPMAFHARSPVLAETVATAAH